MLPIGAQIGTAISAVPTTSRPATRVTSVKRQGNVTVPEPAPSAVDETNKNEDTDMGVFGDQGMGDVLGPTGDKLSISASWGNMG